MWKSMFSRCNNRRNDTPLELFGIQIDTLPRADITERLLLFCTEPHFHRIATVNSEFLLLAEKDAAFRHTLRDADLRVADGIGIALVGFLRGKCVARFPGADLMEAVLHIAEQKQLAVYCAVRADGLSVYDEVRAAILKRFPNSIIGGTDFDVHQVSGIRYQDFKNRIHDTKYKILLCNFGAPEQEFFLANAANNPGSIHLAMGVGGSFDYLTGKLRRAPLWMRRIGLEWLWRLFLQPKRWKRIMNATLFFLWKTYQNTKKTR